jgi:CHAT domain-containing protein
MLEACEKRPNIPVKTAVCIGAPTRFDVPDLPGALEEVCRVANLLRAAHVQVHELTREKATIAALRRFASGSDLIHFACHAGNRTPNEHWAQLLLTPDPEVPDSGILSEDSILSNLLIREGCLVNLAGCRTGMLGNEGRYLRGGLVPAFLAAGAGSVIGSLWPLEDWPAATFQTEYYQKLIAGVPPAEALAITQRECISGKHGIRLQDMRNWGSYLIYGIG